MVLTNAISEHAVQNETNGLNKKKSHDKTQQGDITWKLVSKSGFKRTEAVHHIPERLIQSQVNSEVLIRLNMHHACICYFYFSQSEN